MDKNVCMRRHMEMKLRLLATRYAGSSMHGRSCGYHRRRSVGTWYLTRHTPRLALWIQ